MPPHSLFSLVWSCVFPVYCLESLLHPQPVDSEAPAEEVLVSCATQVDGDRLS